MDEVLSHSIWTGQSQRSSCRHGFGRVATSTASGSVDYWTWTRPNLDDLVAR